MSKQIERIKKRCSDKNFYLAVIGEFSSGKSTFINALLRDDLLKTSALVATATTTKITYSDRFAAEALFKTRRSKQLSYPLSDMLRSRYGLTFWQKYSLNRNLPNIGLVEKKIENH